MKIDQIHFYVKNASWWRNWFTSKMGFEQIAPPTHSDNTLIEAVQSGQAQFLIYSPDNAHSAVARYIQQHPPGVAEVTFEVSHLEPHLQRIREQGVTLRQPLKTVETANGCLRWCQIVGVTGLIHTLVERVGETPLLPWLPNWVTKPSNDASQGLYFTGIDHVVLNVAVGELESTVNWYERVLGLQRKQSFSIQTSRSGLNSQVLAHPEGSLQLPVNQPSSQNSQIQEFLDFNRGSGIQHLALSTPKITEATLNLKQLGISFLRVPETYYTQLQQRFPMLPLSEQEWQQIKQAQVLVDCEATQFDNLSTPEQATMPLLLQIFTKPIFAEPTFFFELIERRYQAQGFGEGNFRALFEAIEREQQQRASL